MEELITKISDVLSRGKSGIIALQNNPSIDGIAAATSLYLALVKKGKTMSIVSASKPQIELAATDKIQPAFAASGNHLVISFPYSDGAIDKVDYSINGNNFNLIIIPNSETQKIDPKDVKFSYTGGKIDFIITVDVPNLNSLGSIYTENQSEFQSKTIINIDRHLINNNFGAVNVVNKSASATSEIVYNIIKGLHVDIDKDIATNLYTGILAATNNFTSFSVTPITFEVTADLMKLGAEKKELPQQVQRPSSFTPPAPAYGNQQGFNAPAPVPSPFGYNAPAPRPLTQPQVSAPMQPNYQPQQMQQAPHQYTQQQQPMPRPQVPAQGYTRQMTQNPYLENQRPQQPYNSFQRPQQQNPYRPEPQQEQSPMPQVQPMPHQVRQQQSQFNQQPAARSPQPYPQQPARSPMGQPVPPSRQPMQHNAQPHHNQQPPVRSPMPQQQVPLREPQDNLEIPQPIPDNNSVQPGYPAQQENTQQPQQSQEPRSPQDWLKPKLFRGNNLL